MAVPSDHLEFGQIVDSRYSPAYGRPRATMFPNDPPASMSRSFACSARSANILASRSSRIVRLTRACSSFALSPSRA